MNLLSNYGYGFVARLISMLLGFFVLILAFGIWFTERSLILPVNTMAYCAGAFAYNSDEAREESVQRLKALDIHTGDEIENLYHAFVKTTEESMQYVTDIQRKTETISKMQNGLIMVLADMVESRDKCTGDHVRKTAAYVQIIMEEMKARGIYEDRLTDQFIEDVKNAAPLHDIGKIYISDVVLNKPGKLTDEEFEIMRSHTTLGSTIIDRAIEIVPESGYLEEAKNLSEYHHEKWNGKGYPHGISGEDIPLSARIMAVADVFDALVSRRSYKEPFTFEKAVEIIREDAGTHFDPLVVEAFLGAEDRVREVAEEFEKYSKENK
ncbi:MAG: HD domain-containing protein [Clostridia bacterium]|nr:HD domain-containing protein [Clostridia bacterium]